MSTKTGTQIEGDILQLFAASTLNATVTGGFFRWGTRPTKEQTLEDVVIKFSAGDGFQIQRGIVRMNIYINDIATGTMTKTIDTARAAIVEAAAVSAFNTIRYSSTEYDLRLDKIPQIEEDAEGTGQHFINFKISFSRVTI